MPVDKIELAKDLATPEYQQLVSDTLKESHVIRTKADNEAFEGRFRQDVIEKEIPKKIGEVHSSYDKDIKSATGLDRLTNEKTYDYMKRAFEAQGDAGLKAKIKDLEDKVAAGGATPADRKKLEDAEKLYQVQLAERDEEIKALRGMQTTTRKEAALTSAYATLKGTFTKSLPAMFDRTEKVILSEILTRVGVDEDGKLYETNADGTFKKDKAFNKIPAEQILAAEFKDVIDKGNGKKGGAGSTGGERRVEDPNTVTAETYHPGDEVKTGEELMTQMLKDGIKRGSQLFNDIWAKHRPTLPDAKNMKLPPAPKK